MTSDGLHGLSAEECAKPLRFRGACYHSRAYPLLTNLAAHIATVGAENDRTLLFWSFTRLGVTECQLARDGASENGVLASGREMSEEKLLFSLLKMFFEKLKCN